MSKNKGVGLALRFCQVIIGLVLVLFLLFAGLIIYSLIDPEALPLVVLKDAFDPKFGMGVFIASSAGEDNLVYLNQLSSGMKAWLLIRMTLFFVLLLMILRMALQVLRSVRSKSTFYQGNVQYFKRMAAYGTFMAILASFNFAIANGEMQLNLGLPIGPIAFALSCRVLAEVFSEGQGIMEDNKSIV